MLDNHGASMTEQKLRAMAEGYSLSNGDQWQTAKWAADEIDLLRTFVVDLDTLHDEAHGDPCPRARCWVTEALSEAPEARVASSKEAHDA